MRSGVAKGNTGRVLCNVRITGGQQRREWNAVHYSTVVQQWCSTPASSP